ILLRSLVILAGAVRRNLCDTCDFCTAPKIQFGFYQVNTSIKPNLVEASPLGTRIHISNPQKIKF
ncbi:hypothetical protein EAF18_07960, partial [Staphylococcus pseudintermedius]|nr:hypothetical protein [Staphylococcus pseudintermedius]